MDKDTKICPFCGKEIKSAAIKCRYCGEYLNERKQLFKINKKIAFTITSLILLIVTFSILFSSEYYSAHNVVAPHEDVRPEHSTLTAEMIINIIIAQEKDVSKYLHGVHLKSSKGIAFKKFLENTDYYLEVFNVYKFYSNNEYSYDDSFDIYRQLENGETVYKKGLTLTPVMSKNKEGYEYVKEVLISSPKIDSINMVYAGEAFFNAQLNYTFLVKEYSKYLPKDWQDYLKIKEKIQKTLDGNTLYLDGALSVEYPKLLDWIISFQNFQKKYPKFALNSSIKKEIKDYTGAVIWSPYRTFDVFTNKFKPEARKAYEDYLAKANKNTAEYRWVEKCYSSLKKNNYVFSEEHRACYDSGFND